jgi:putative ABC transport system substrate-binding protein
MMQYEAGITGKWLSMLKEISPRLARAALLGNPKTTAYDYFLRSAKAAARSLSVEPSATRAQPPIDTLAIRGVAGSLSGHWDGRERDIVWLPRG